MCTPAPSESVAGTNETSVTYSVHRDQWCRNVEILERKMFCYLVQSVVGRHGHSVGVQHEPLSQESKEAVCVHDLHLPPVDKHTHTDIMVKWLV